jgi:hypothetical protein
MPIKSKLKKIIRHEDLSSLGFHPGDARSFGEIVSRLARRNLSNRGFNLEEFKIQFQGAFVTSDEIEEELALGLDRQEGVKDGGRVYTPNRLEDLAELVRIIAFQIEYRRKDAWKADLKYDGELEVFDDVSDFKKQFRKLRIHTHFSEIRFYEEEYDPEEEAFRGLEDLFDVYKWEMQEWFETDRRWLHREEEEDEPRAPWEDSSRYW